MPKKIKKNSFLFLLMFTLTMVSCDSKRVFDQYVAIENAEWEAQKPVSFSFSVNDTLVQRNLFINVRNNNNYPFSNLFLITKMKFPDNQQIVDTLEYDMADITGKFLGEGFSEIKENKLFYKEHIQFPKTGEYTIDIMQAMRKNGEIEGVTALEGVTDVGFRIEKIQ